MFRTYNMIALKHAKTTDLFYHYNERAVEKSDQYLKEKEKQHRKRDKLRLHMSNHNPQFTIERDTDSTVYYIHLFFLPCT